jgi:cation:H+ antiporter
MELEHSFSLAAVIAISTPLLIALPVFLCSLLLVMGAAAWFTRRLELLCDRLDLSAGMLSMLGALGANIPNYVASMVAIASGQLDVGLGIIIGSNIYNIAIIMGISALAAPGWHGIRLQSKEIRDVRIIAAYALAIMLATLLLVWLLPGTPFIDGLHLPLLSLLLLIVTAIITLGMFVALALHIVRRPHPAHEAGAAEATPAKAVRISLVRLLGEVVVSLAVALGGVVVMVQSGQALTADLHMPGVLAGLLVLAVATSLPNTVVAVFLVRTERMAACVEEIFSSNSINATLGIALPLLFWRAIGGDLLLLLLDAPLMVALTLAILLGVHRGNVSRVVGVVLLLSYTVWVIVHLLL